MRVLNVRVLSAGEMVVFRRPFNPVLDEHPHHGAACQLMIDVGMAWVDEQDELPAPSQNNFAMILEDLENLQ